jgi:hypothetical protein
MQPTLAGDTESASKTDWRGVDPPTTVTRKSARASYFFWYILNVIPTIFSGFGGAKKKNTQKSRVFFFHKTKSGWRMKLEVHLQSQIHPYIGLYEIILHTDVKRIMLIENEFSASCLH